MQQQQHRLLQHTDTGCSNASSSSSNSSLTGGLLVAAQMCVVAAMSGVQLAHAAAALQQMQQQAMQRQAQLQLFKAAAAAATAAAAAAAAEARPSPAAAAAGTAADCSVEQVESELASFVSNVGGDGVAATAAADADAAVVSNCTLAGILETGSDESLPAQGSGVSPYLQQQQQPCGDWQQCQCCCHNIHAQHLPRVPLVPPKVAALLEQFTEALAEPADHAHIGSSSTAIPSNEGRPAKCHVSKLPAQQQQQRQPQQGSSRDMAAALNSQLAFGSGPLHGSLLAADGGLVPKVQVHSCSSSSSSVLATAAAGVAAAAGALQSTSTPKQQAAAAVLGGLTTTITPAVVATAAAADGAAAQQHVPARAREGWLRSGLYDPLGMLQPQLAQAQSASLQQQKQPQVVELRAASRLPIGLASAAGSRCGGMLATGLVNRQEQMEGATSMYVSLSAASNQRQIGGFVMPGRQQIKKQVLQEERQRQQHCLGQQQQQRKHMNGDGSERCCSATGFSSSGGAMPSNDRAAGSCGSRVPQRLQGSQIQAAADAGGGGGSDEEEDGVLRQLPTGAADAPGKRHPSLTGGSSSSSGWHHQWSVPAYSSETGYIGGLYDEDTGTMYID
jgi:hypothetical protein